MFKKISLIFLISDSLVSIFDYDRITAPRCIQFANQERNVEKLDFSEYGPSCVSYIANFTEFYSLPWNASQRMTG